MKKWLAAMIFSLAMLSMLMTAGCGSIPIGDGGSINIQKDGIELQSDDDQLGSIDISVNDDGEMILSGTDESGEKIEQKVSREQTVLPEGFPQDLPIPTDTELTIIESEIGEQMQYMVSYTIEGNVFDTYNQYRLYVEQAAYPMIIDASDGNAEADTAHENIMAKSDEETLTIGIMNKGTGKYDDGSITVNIMYLAGIE